MIVMLSGAAGKGKMSNARVEIVTYWAVQRLPGANAETWLDRVIVADEKLAIREKGFGAEVSKAIRTREDWLIAHGRARSGALDTITPNPKLLSELALANRVATESGLAHRPLTKGARFHGRHVKTVDLPMRRLAVIANTQEFALVPWQPELIPMRGRDLSLSVQNHAVTVSISRGLQRDLGLSR